MPYNVRAELDARFPLNPTDHDALVDPLMDLIEDFDGVVARTPAGRVELIFTVPADTMRQAIATAMAVVTSAGCLQPYALEVMPQEEFVRRSSSANVPPLVSVPQAAEILGVSRQRALELARGGKLDAFKVGDAWVIPRQAVTARASELGEHRPAEVVSYP